MAAFTTSVQPLNVLQASWIRDATSLERAFSPRDLLVHSIRSRNFDATNQTVYKDDVAYVDAILIDL